jgi:hypothetical protein
VIHVRLASSIVLVAFASTCLVGRDPQLKEAFTEDFGSGRLDPQTWRITQNVYEIRDGALFVQGAKNHPMWLQRRLPCDVKIEFTAWSESAAGDIKVEAFGDGRSSADTEGAYTGTGYIVIFGGWDNTVNTIARRDEHNARMKLEEESRVEKDRRYRFTLMFRGPKIEWFLDGRLFLSVEDPDRLCGPGNEYFGFNDWDTPVHFDELTIVPL